MITGYGNSFIATLVERHSRLMVLAKVENEDSHRIIQALQAVTQFKKELYRTFTWDRGTEMAGHKKFT